MKESDPRRGIGGAMGDECNLRVPRKTNFFFLVIFEFFLPLMRHSV